ncbi:VanZ family protein [Paenibacillus albus]|uniref:VanZ family protein n=2 Tax=Paenibacillus albus TaxID=2495582 RepID=A0A3S9AC27_9BACL|nr:VanZ family protein [Paenibacillus albus]
MWVMLIFHFSSEPYQKQTIIPFLHQHFNEDTVRRLLPDVTVHYLHSAISAKSDPFGFIEFVFRKSAHMFVYGVFAIVVYIALYPLRLKLPYSMLASLIIVAGIASLDEWNQLFTGGRTSTIRDVGVDVSGGMLFLLIFILLSKWARYIKSKNVKKSALL